MYILRANLLWLITGLSADIRAERPITPKDTTNGCVQNDHRKGNNMGKKEKFEDEEMTVDIELDEGTVTCAIITILEVEGKDYIVLMPLKEDGTANDEGEVWFYGYKENPEDPNEEPELIYIEDDEEYEKVADAFDEYLDNVEFDELIDEE